MADLILTARPRTVIGKKVAKLRRAGVTPANIYGHNVASTAIEADTHQLDLLLRRAGHTHLVTLTISGEREPRAVLVRAVSRKPTTDRLLHVDFIQVSMREPIRVSVPVVLVGAAPVLEMVDGIAFQNLESIEVECLPGDIPDHVEADLSALTETTSVVHVRDLSLPAGMTVISDPDALVVNVTLQGPAEEEEAAPAEAAEAEEIPTVREQEGEAEQS